DLCEPNVVTELPKALFKKPKLRDNYSAAGLDCEDGAKLRRPVFGKRNVKKKFDNPGDLCEPNVVTELPKALFKKPKLRDNYSAAGLDCEDGAKLRRPVFGKRNVKKKFDNPELSLMALGLFLMARLRFRVM
nr:MRN complex-interacting protein [Tanacetum cinerariifolium]